MIETGKWSFKVSLTWTDIWRILICALIGAIGTKIGGGFGHAVHDAAWFAGGLIAATPRRLATKSVPPPPQAWPGRAQPTQPGADDAQDHQT